MIASRPVAEFLCRPQCFLTLPETKQLSVEKGHFFSRGGDELSAEVRLNQSFTLSPIVPREEIGVFI